jgi:hypothetical protein
VTRPTGDGGTDGGGSGEKKDSGEAAEGGLVDFLWLWTSDRWFGFAFKERRVRLSESGTYSPSLGLGKTPTRSRLETAITFFTLHLLRACLFGLSMTGCAGKAAVWRKLLCRESCCSEF